MIECAEYKLADPEALETPAMLVFEAQLEHNIRALCELVGGGENLVVHVKTHKSAAVAARQLEAGIAGFKCATLKELQMALEAGGRLAILSYPLVQRRKVERFCELAAAHAGAEVDAIVGARGHVELLGEVAGERRQRLRVLLDLDVGMHRTGVAPGEEARSLYRALCEQEHLEPAGLHVYDGQDHVADPDERRRKAQRHIEEVRAFKQGLERAGLSVPRVVAGGSFSFPYYAREADMQGSPGTCIYWDAGYGGAMPDMPFRWAALVLTQVVDRHPEQGSFTTDLGYKAICGDVPLQRRARLLGLEEAVLHLQSEEHGLFHLEGEVPALGRYFLAVPGHVCPTTIRYPGSYLVDAEGEVVDYYIHTARDRS